jgi:hypothetical protein
MFEFIDHMLVGTPVWVYVLFVFLLIRGIKARQPPRRRYSSRGCASQRSCQEAYLPGALSVSLSVICRPTLRPVAT